MSETLLGVLIGGLLATVGPVFIAIVQTRSARKTAWAQLATQAGLEEYKTHMAEAHRQQPGDHLVPPLISYIHYQVEALGLAEKGKLSVDEIRKLNDRHGEFLSAYPKIGSS